MRKMNLPELRWFELFLIKLNSRRSNKAFIKQSSTHRNFGKNSVKKIYSIYISIFIVIIDQLSKHMIINNFIAYQPKKLFTGLNFTLAYNTGAAFSFLDNSGPWHQLFFCAFSITMICVISIWIARIKPSKSSHIIALSLILGGAIGNLIDRLHYGHVIDFIDVYYKTHHWPVFNVADSAICIGAFLYLCMDFKNDNT